MINEVLEIRVQCPYCWERFTLLIDGSVDNQEYTEDCEICCRPMLIAFYTEDGDEVVAEARGLGD